MFQALGNTVPALLSSASRLLTFVLPLVLLSRLPGFRLQHVWWLSVGTTTLQALFSLWLLRREFQRKLRPAGAQPETTLSTVTK
jgi:Na+-driven multidrug efflux pump